MGFRGPLVVVCVCAFPWRGLRSALGKLKSTLGGESPSRLSGGWLGHGQWVSQCPFSDICASADRLGSLDCRWEWRRTRLGDGFHPIEAVVALEKCSLPQPNAHVCS